MKATTHLTYTLILAVWLFTGCQNNEAEEQKRQLAAQKAKLEEVKRQAVVPSAAFVAFVNGFDSGMHSASYNSQWLQSFSSNNSIKEISPKVCENFIHGNPVWNHQLDKTSASSARKILSENKPYYYVGQMTATDQYTALVFTDLEEDATETYLCTFTKDGQYISGIVLQAEHQAEDLVATRSTHIEGSHQLKMKVTENVNDITSALNYTLLPNGEIVPAEKNM